MRKNHTMPNGRVLLVLAAALVSVGGLATPAMADDGPTTAQIMSDCDSGMGKCTFNNPVLGQAYLGSFHKVSDSLYNCTSSAATQSMTWSDTVGSTDSAGVSVTVGGKIAELIDVSVTASYSHTWSTSHSESSALTMTVQPGEVGWISRAQVMQDVSGTWQTHYNSRHWGHYYWFVNDTITSPVPNGTDGANNSVVMSTRAMTPAEKASCSAGFAGGRTMLLSS